MSPSGLIALGNVYHGERNSLGFEPLGHPIVFQAKLFITFALVSLRMTSLVPQ
jgi:hypothetical protein